jgi:hypothetical protein
LKIGDRVKIVKQTFLHNGIFVHSKSTVEIKEINDSTVVGIYIDKEGFPHDISFSIADLEPIS